MHCAGQSSSRWEGADGVQIVMTCSRHEYPWSISDAFLRRNGAGRWPFLRQTAG
jgi:hypothetical protein